MRNQLNTQAVEQITQIKKILSEKFNVKQLIIFGSQVDGKADEDSDMDLCIITDLKNKRKIDVIREIRRELKNLISFPLDILVYSEKEFTARAALRTTLEHTIQMYGKKVYG